MWFLQQLGTWTGTLQTGVSALARTQVRAYEIATAEQCYAMQQVLQPVVSHGTAAQTTTLHTVQLNARVEIYWQGIKAADISARTPLS